MGKYASEHWFIVFVAQEGALSLSLRKCLLNLFPKMTGHLHAVSVRIYTVGTRIFWHVWELYCIGMNEGPRLWHLVTGICPLDDVLDSPGRPHHRRGGHGHPARLLVSPLLRNKACLPFLAHISHFQVTGFKRSLMIFKEYSYFCRGSIILYRKFIHPLLLQREAEIDELIQLWREQSYQLGIKYLQG